MKRQPELLTLFTFILLSITSYSENFSGGTIYKDQSGRTLHRSKSGTIMYLDAFGHWDFMPEESRSAAPKSSHSTPVNANTGSSPRSERVIDEPDPLIGRLARRGDGSGIIIFWNGNSGYQVSAPNELHSSIVSFANGGRVVRISRFNWINEGGQKHLEILGLDEPSTKEIKPGDRNSAKLKSVLGVPDESVCGTFKVDGTGFLTDDGREIVIEATTAVFKDLATFKKFSAPHVGRRVCLQNALWKGDDTVIFDTVPEARLLKSSSHKSEEIVLLVFKKRELMVGDDGEFTCRVDASLVNSYYQTSHQKTAEKKSSSLIGALKGACSNCLDMIKTKGESDDSCRIQGCFDKTGKRLTISAEMKNLLPTRGSKSCR